VVVRRPVHRVLVRVGLEVAHHRCAQDRQRFDPDRHADRILSGVGELEAVVAEGHQVAVVAEVEELVAGAFGGFAGEVVELVEAVEVDLERLI
jgi:hypothetical protein